MHMALFMAPQALSSAGAHRISLHRLAPLTCLAVKMQIRCEIKKLMAAKQRKGWVWWLTPMVPASSALGKLRQGDCYEFKGSLSYIESSEPVRTLE